MLLHTTPPPTETYTLSLHDALPISAATSTRSSISCSASAASSRTRGRTLGASNRSCRTCRRCASTAEARPPDHHSGSGRSEEHTSELQSLRHLVCRLLLEKKKNTTR